MRWPVLQSSANVSGGIDAQTLDEVPEGIRRGADLVLDGGELNGTPSTVVDLRRFELDGMWAVLRQGAVPERDIEHAAADARSGLGRWYGQEPHSNLELADDRPAARLLRAPPLRRRSGGRGGHGPRARPAAPDARDDRLGELRAAGDPGVPGQRAHQQVRGGLPGQALLRRLRARRRDRAARDRPREGAVRRRARQRPAARRRAGQHGRLPRAAAARRHDPGPRARRTAATSATG